MTLYTFKLPATVYDPEQHFFFLTKKEAIAEAHIRIAELAKMNEEDIVGVRRVFVERFKLVKGPKAWVILRCLNQCGFILAGSREFVCDIPVPWGDE